MIPLDEDEAAKKIFVSTGMTEEEATQAIEKLKGLKDQIARAIVEGKVKSTEDLMQMVKDSGVIPADSFDKIMEKMKE